MRQFIGGPSLHREICQQLQAIKIAGRSADNIASSLVPVANNHETSEKLRRIVALGIEISDLAGNLYNDIAREAFSE